MGPISVRSRRRWRISSWPAANGMSASSAVPMQIEAPSGTKRATASRMDMSLGGGTGVSYSTPGPQQGSGVAYLWGSASKSSLQRRQQK